jgi:hypothetical protein
MLNFYFENSIILKILIYLPTANENIEARR